MHIAFIEYVGMAGQATCGDGSFDIISIKMRLACVTNGTLLLGKVVALSCQTVSQTREYKQTGNSQ